MTTEFIENDLKHEGNPNASSGDPQKGVLCSSSKGIAYVVVTCTQVSARSLKGQLVPTASHSIPEPWQQVACPGGLAVCCCTGPLISSTAAEQRGERGDKAA